jgi:Flp pilus assembly protein TadD
MAEELERNGDKAIVDEDYDQAVTLYTQAIELDPENPSLYVSRAQAHMKLQNFAGIVAGCSLSYSFGTPLR